MTIRNLVIVPILMLVLALASCDQPTLPVDPASVFDSLVIEPASGFYKPGSLLTLSFSGVVIDTATYEYRWTIGDSIRTDSLQCTYYFKDVGRYIINLSIFERIGMKRVASRSTIVHIPPVYLTSDMLSMIRGYSVKFGGYGTIRYTSKSDSLFKDTTFSIQPFSGSFNVIAGTLFSSNTGWSSQEITKSTNTSKGGRQGISCRFDSLLQVLYVSSMFMTEGGQYQSNNPDGIDNDNSSYYMNMSDLYLNVQSYSPNQVIFELPTTKIPAAINHIMYGYNGHYLRVGIGGGWDVYSLQLVSINNTIDTLKPYLNVTLSN